MAYEPGREAAALAAVARALRTGRGAEEVAASARRPADGRTTVAEQGSESRAPLVTPGFFDECWREGCRPFAGKADAGFESLDFADGPPEPAHARGAEEQRLWTNAAADALRSAGCENDDAVVLAGILGHSWPDEVRRAFVEVPAANDPPSGSHKRKKR